MKKIKLEKGITLVALIITIIVLLILAMVSIATVSDTGIIKHAKQSVKEHIIGEEKEKITLAYSSYQLAKYTSNDAKLEIEGATVTGNEELGHNIKFNETNNYYSIDSNGDITSFENVEVPNPAFSGIYDVFQRYAGESSNLEFVHYDINAKDKELKFSTTPQIPAKLTYADGSVENVILYYTGEVNNGYDDEKTGYWSYCVDGTPVLNDDGTYTWQNGSGASIGLESYTTSGRDGTITYPSDETHLLWIYDGYGSNPQSKLVNLREIEILGEKVINTIDLYTIMALIEKNEVQLCKNTNNIKRVIINYSNAPQDILMGFDYDDTGISVFDEEKVIMFRYEQAGPGEEFTDEATGKTYNAMMEILLRNSGIESITFEEEVDGELVMNTVELNKGNLPE